MLNGIVNYRGVMEYYIASIVISVK